MLAWQFLRRNPEYQLDFEFVISPVQKLHAKRTWSQYSPPLEAIDHKTFLQLAEKYGLAAPVFPSPHLSEPDPLFFRAHRGVSFPNPKHYTPTEGKELIEFDLTMPLDIQLHRLKLYWPSLLSLRNIKSYSGRHRINLLPTYLRVLDAIDSKAKTEDVIAVLLPSRANDYSDGYSASKTLENWRRAAVEYRDWKYQTLPLIEKDAATYS